MDNQNIQSFALIRAVLLVINRFTTALSNLFTDRCMTVGPFLIELMHLLFFSYTAT